LDWNNPDISLNVFGPWAGKRFVKLGGNSSLRHWSITANNSAGEGESINFGIEDTFIT
jgi:hypothetical protein